MSQVNQDHGHEVATLDGSTGSLESSSPRVSRDNSGNLRLWFSATLSRKNLMALTGLFLCFFLVIHLFGNLQLLLPPEAAQWQFNFYSKLLAGNIFIQFISYALFASILAHVLYALFITLKNRRANGKRYLYDRRALVSKWYSRKMGLLGTVILFFLVIHLRDFWYRSQFGYLPLDKDGQRDLYTLVITVYRNGWYVLIYVLSMVALAYHLLHGFFSAARSLGIYHPRYVGLVKAVGWVYSIGIGAGFAFIPVFIYFVRQ
jgi:succinate dehydrogenase / fumarate reductase, cytochrome b subunit